MSLGLTPGVPGAPEPRIYPRSRYFLVIYYLVTSNFTKKMKEKKNDVNDFTWKGRLESVAGSVIQAGI